MLLLAVNVVGDNDNVGVDEVVKCCGRRRGRDCGRDCGRPGCHGRRRRDADGVGVGTGW